jgi:hypothetical protein
VCQLRFHERFFGRDDRETFRNKFFDHAGVSHVTQRIVAQMLNLQAEYLANYVGGSNDKRSDRQDSIE